MPNRKLIFVVDDDPGMLRGVKRLLREHGYDGVLFPSAEAFQNHNNFEEALCIILDINLKDESGIELRRRLKAAGIWCRSSTSLGTTTPPFARRRWNPVASPISQSRARRRR